jgi:hypothetical protein
METTIKPGVFTPWGEALCRDCHDRADTKASQSTHRTFDWSSYVADADDEPGFCTRCGDPCLLNNDVAGLTRIRKEVGGDLEQTGGMCAALAFRSPAGGPLVLVTIDEEILVGKYASEDQLYDGGGQFFPVVGELAAVAAIRAALKNGCANCHAETVGDCPRCFAATGKGCAHGVVCDQCADDAKANEVRS